MNIKAIIKNNRILHIAARRVQYFIKNHKRSISGKNNRVINKGVSINVKFDIIGNNNTIEIMKGAVLSDIEIYMRGD